MPTPTAPSQQSGASAFARRAARLFILLAVLAPASVAQTVSNGDGRETPGALKPGTSDGSYGLSDIESISLYNGGLNVSFPLLKVGGRGDASYTMTQAIDRPEWSVDHELVIYDRYGYGNTYSTWLSHLTPEMKKTRYRVGYGPGVVHGRHAADRIVSCNGPENEPTVYGQTFTFLEFKAPDGTEHALYDELNAYIGSGCQGGANRGRVFSARATGRGSPSSPTATSSTSPSTTSTTRTDGRMSSPPPAS